MWIEQKLEYEELIIMPLKPFRQTRFDKSLTTVDTNVGFGWEQRHRLGENGHFLHKALLFRAPSSGHEITAKKLTAKK